MRYRYCLIPLAAFALVAKSSSATPVELTLPSPVSGPLEATIYLEELSDALPVSLRTRKTIVRTTLPWQGAVHVEGTARSRIEVRGTGFRCTTGELVPDQEEQHSVTCQMAPAGLVAGNLQLSPPQEQTARFLRLAFQSSNSGSDGAANRILASNNFVFCDLDDAAFECPLPAKTLDVRLDLEGYSPLYLWGLEVTAGGKEMLGTLTLKKGATVAGTVIAQGRLKTPHARVDLRPRQAARDAYRSDFRSQGLKGSTALVDNGGRFQLSGISPGDYVVEISAPDSCMVTKRVQVSFGDNFVFLHDPIKLGPCLDLDVFVEPPFDFGSENWVLSLEKANEVDSQSAIRSLPVEINGAAVIKSLEVGEYELEVQDHEGDVWWTRTIDIYPSMPAVFAEIEAVRVRGSASQGERPLEGTLIFGTSTRRPRVAMDIDEKGSFEGYLPSQGLWALELVRDGDQQFLDPVGVEVPGGKSYAEVEISIPDTLLSGEVLRDGRPMPGAIVTVLRGVDRLEKEMFATSDENGEFSFSGLRSGNLQLRAAFEDLVSGWEFLKLQDSDKIDDVILDLAAKLSVQGRVSAHGTGTAGVRIVGFPSKQTGPMPPTGAVTAANGTFDVRVSKDAERLSLAVLPSGHEALLALSQPGLVEQVWPVIDIQLQGTSGTLVLQTDDPSLGGWVSFGGAVVPMRAWVNLMAQTGRLNRENYQGISLHDLAVGLWIFCLESSNQSCVSTELLAGEVAMVDLRGRSSE